MSTTPYAGLTRGGREWRPRFIVALDQSRCIGCGRCFKGCPRDVFELVDRAEQDDDDAEETARVMSIRDELDCIGCASCAKVCPKGCLTHATDLCAT